MEKRWYIIYAKPGCERKVAGQLTRKKIENYLPFNRKNIQYLRKNKVVKEPLFDSYVFANIRESEVSVVENLSNVLNLMYWKNQPVTVKEDEINNIKEFTTYHQDIRLERIDIDANGESKLMDIKSHSIDGKTLMIKKRRVRVALPTLGFTMIASLKKEDFIGNESLLNTEEIALQ